MQGVPNSFTVQHLEQWIVCTSLSVNVFITLATQQLLEYHYEARFETPCTLITCQISAFGLFYIPLTVRIPYQGRHLS
jgi:hypothetical protein